MQTHKKPFSPFTIGIMGWSAYTISGTGTLLRTLLKELHNNDLVQYIVALPNTKTIPQSLTKLHDEFAIKETVVINKPNYDAPIHIWLQEAYLAIKDKIDLIFYPDSITLPKTILSNTTQSVTLLHDIIPLSLPEYYLNPFKYYQEKKKFVNIANNSDYIVTISQYSLRMIKKKLQVPNTKLKLIYNGVDETFNKFLVSSQNSSHLNNSKRKGILYVGDLRKRKNVLSLVKAYLDLNQEIHEQHPLILVADGRLKRTIIKMFPPNSLSNQKLIFYSHLLPHELIAIYSQAKVMVFPSLLEGFGLPIIEAQQCGTPVICGDHSSLGEITHTSTIKNSAFHVNVKKPNEIRDAIIQLLNNKNLYQQYQELGYQNSNRFTADTMAKQYQNFFIELATNKVNQ